MPPSQSRELRHKPFARVKRAISKAKTYFRKKVVLFSALALIGGCSAPNTTGFETNVDSGQTISLDSGISKDGETDKPKAFACQKEKNGCSRFAELIDENCKTKKEFSDLCKKENTISVKELESSIESGKFKITFEGAVLKKNECTTYQINGKKYTVVYLQEHPVTPELIVFDNNLNDYSSGIGLGKYLRMGQDGSISLVSMSNGEHSITLSFHKTISPENISVQVHNFNMFASEEDRKEFKKNTMNYLVTISNISGINLGECYKDVNYFFDPKLYGGECLDGSGEYGYIRVGGFVKVFFDPSEKIKYEHHEPIHLLDHCVNKPHLDAYNHLFFSATAELLTREYGDIKRADAYLDYLSKTVNEIENMLATNTKVNKSNGRVLDCFEIREFILNREYLRLTGLERKEFIRKFYAYLRDQPCSMFQSQVTKNTICGLVSDPSCTDVTKEFCSS
jgi:hypothetical protein